MKILARLMVVCGIAAVGHAQGIWSGGAGGTQSVTDFAQGAAITGGAVDSKPAFDRACAAIAARGGGRLRVPKGQYRYDSSSAFSDMETFCGEASNVFMFGDGPGVSVINFTGAKGLYLGLGRADINRLCTSPPNTGCSIPAYGLPSYYLFNNVSTGSSVTMTTHADAGNFTAGGIVFLESGDASPGTGHPPTNFEYNQVVSANATTGVVALLNPLSDAYSSGTPPYVPMMAQISVVQNVTIQGIGFTSSHAGSVILNTEGTLNTTIQDCTFTAIANAPADVWNSYSWHTTIKNSMFFGTKADLGDAGGYWSFIGNQVSGATDNYTGSGAGREWTFDRNLFIAQPLVLGGSATYQFRGLRATNNMLQLSSTDGFPTGMALSYVDTPAIRGNACYGVVVGGNEGSCVTLRDGSANVDLTNNSALSAGLKYGAFLQGATTAVSVHDNVFSGNTYGVTIGSSATGTKMACNNFISIGTSNIDNSGTATAYTCAPAAPVVFAGLPSCAAGLEGYSRAVTDSTTATWGATITGTGSNHVMAFCNGTNWTVAAK